jgi:hypothetical protein
MDIRACPMAAVKWPVWYFLDEVLQLNTETPLVCKSTNNRK